MKKLLFFILIVLTAALVFASSASEKSADHLTLAVMQGPTGFSSAGLPDWIDVKLYPSPVEAVTNLINGTIDMAVIPANKAAQLYNKGMDIKAVAVVGEGMLSVIGTENHSDIINVPGAGDTPDLLCTLLYPEYERNYSVTAPAQVAQLLIAGKTDLAILPQPFVNKALASNGSLKVIKNVSEDWSKKTGTDQYPMSVLVASGSALKDNTSLVDKVAEEYRKSVEWVKNNPEQAGEIIEKLGIMSREMASISIKDCNLVFIEGKEAREELETYFEIILGNVPDEGFFF